MLNGAVRRWWLVGLLVIALAMAAGCVTEEYAEETDYILAELGKDSAPSGPLSFGEDDEVIVYSADVPDLLADIRSAPLEADKREVVSDYLTLQSRVDCILEGIEESAEENSDLACQGTILVQDVGEHGLPGVADIMDAINTREDEPTKRGYLSDYIGTWSENQRIERVGESLEQMKRTSGIPLFGALVSAIHNFPIMYEGEILVPEEDIPGLIDDYHDHDTDEARRQTVSDYLSQ